MDFISGCVKTILEKYMDPIISKIKEISKSEWEKFKIDSDIAFRNYLENAYKKYSKIKTILYRTEPKYLYDFFEFPNLEKGYDCQIDSTHVDNLLDISHFLIVQGTGGIGKSTFMKHLFIDELNQNDLIPIFIELKDLNEIDSDYNIQDFIFNKLYNLGSEINPKFMEYALQSGCFLLLLDGYDEILSDKKNVFFKKLTDFCDLYSNNYYIISSRPYSEFIEFQRFTVLSLCNFSKEQAISLVEKIDFDQKIKKQFSQALSESLYQKHRSFASNPLLLNIMLLTYDNYADIPEKLHLFYANAFETLYSKHDATKGGYKRELKAKLSIDLFEQVFSKFCFITYFQGKIEFTNQDLFAFLEKSKINNVQFDIDAMIDDLVSSICVLYKDGLNYRFTHRSFQEYFSALFLKELSDKNLSKMGIELIKRDAHRAAKDSVFYMLYDMAESRMEQNVILPLLEMLEKECTCDKYDFYFLKLKLEFWFDFLEDSVDPDVPKLVLLSGTGDETVQFIKEFVLYYRNRYFKQFKSDDSELLKYLEKNMNYNIGEEINCIDLFDDKEFYQIFKNTWIGNLINNIANFKDVLNTKKQEGELDLHKLLMID